MVYLPTFQYEVFISYAWVNNYPEDESDSESGWITRFKNRLQPRLDERLGRKGAARLFFDCTSLQHNKNFDLRIEQALQQSATFVAFISDGYLASTGCGQEMRLFHKIAGANSGRLFLVHLEDTDRSQWPSEHLQNLKNIIGYRFFRQGPSDGSSVKLAPGSSEFEKEFESLRTALATQLKSMRAERSHPQEPEGSKPRPTVLIAKTTPDLRHERKALANYCMSAGLRVLPESPWPSPAEEFSEAFAAALKESHVFVQLLSISYADREPLFPSGIETYQNQLAQQAGLTILQWRDQAAVLDGLDDDAHRALLMAPNVRAELPALFHQEVVERTYRAFHICQDTRHKTDDATALRLVLVRADGVDNEPTERIVHSLSEANIGCRVTQNGVPLVQRLREIHFDALIVVMGRCRDKWCEDQGEELLAVDLNHKDQVPLRAYCLWGERRRLPYVRRDMLQVVVPDELDVLIQAIRQGVTPR